MTTEVLNETDYKINAMSFAGLADFVLHQMHVSPAAELSMIFVDEDAMSVLHERWLGLPGPTDVMSFPMDELRPGTPGAATPPGVLGDIVICPSVAAVQAERAGHGTEEEMLLLATHGILHLLGYDHAEVEEEAVMFELQRKLLLSYLAQE